MKANQQFRVQGMDCAEEVAVLKRELGPLVGGEEHLAFDLLKAKMSVLESPAGLSSDEIVRAVARTGMRAQPWREVRVGEESSAWSRHGRTALTVASGLAALLGFGLHVALAGSVRAAIGSEGLGGSHVVPGASRCFYAAAIVAGLWSVLPKAIFAVRRLRPDMNLLMTIAVIGAVGIGEWLEGATVAFLFSLSLALEAWSVGRARRAVAALLDLAPQTARVMSGGIESEVSVGEVPVGSRIAVHPGERIPLDGRVVAGASAVNQAPITGESALVAKAPGDDVFAGTVNGDGALEVETSKPAEESLLAHIIRLVDEAQTRRAPSERWVEAFARVYTPAVMMLAVLVLVVPPLVMGGGWQTWIYRALALLVIACPCALVISTPVSIVAALTAAARSGVLIKGGLYVELPAKLRAIALDKTGTLTWGRPVVVEVVPLNGHTEMELLSRVAGLEARSEHPLARAVLAYAKERGVVVEPASDFQILQGRGASGRVAGKEYWIGSHRLLEERGQEEPDVHQRLEAMSAAGRSVIVAGTEQHVCGILAVADEVRDESRTALAALRREGIEAVVMLTGDNDATAKAVAAATGVDEVRSELLPADKVAAVEELLGRFGTVAMIGDGVNDAPAMARATLSVAMGAAGTDAAIETADIALMSDDLSQLPWLIRHSRRTLQVVRQNITFSLAVKALFVVLALGGVASLWAAIAADMGASLLVIANGLRLLRGTGGSQRGRGPQRP
jgi:Cd2+/Zn2+-exporting ATPase